MAKLLRGGRRHDGVLRLRRSAGTARHDLPESAPLAWVRLHHRLLHLLAGNLQFQPVHLDSPAPGEPLQYAAAARGLIQPHGIAARKRAPDATVKKQIPATVDTGSSLYVSEAKIHPREIDGTTQRLRKL